MFQSSWLRKTRWIVVTLAATLFAGCSGNNPSSSPSSSPAAAVTQLCPASLDYSTTYTGGSSGGDYIKVQFDTTHLSYQMQFVLSDIPTTAGQINTTRAGDTITGSFHHATTFASAEQNRCTFVLDNGVSADGTYTVTINPADPPTLFVGEGIVTGGIPGATIEFDGVALLGNLGAIPSRTFDFFSFIGFAETETDFAKVAGAYNELGMHLSPTGTSFQTVSPQGWQPDVVNWNETLNADGSCTITTGSDYSCNTTGTPWTLRANADSTSDNVFVSQPTSSSSAYPSAGQEQPIILLAPSQAQAIMIVGKLGSALIPVVIRVGQSYIPSDNSALLNSVIDLEFGMSVLAPATALPASAITGSYIGPTSAPECAIVGNAGNIGLQGASEPSFNDLEPHPNLPGVFDGTYFDPTAGSCLDGTATSTLAANYTATTFNGATASFIAPSATATRTSAFSLDYTQSTPGLVGVTALQAFNASSNGSPVAIFNAGAIGWTIQVGGVYAMVMNSNLFNPFFSVGMVVQ
ncbi:DUF2957 domain-containing protein [Pararobbsia silviterrae]|uniref:DUF2957 domain-containing protein n=1 Tax=Pararobbsia silviterrae TaxID=1792498 RepID=A0A494Y0L1_9BURK|nr:DUF2957 domain-containing protein [Pararobbsia silviterrae]RKP55779.1 DUF2957 domain-containing protein [Pararobbsia silviterrae]